MLWVTLLPAIVVGMIFGGWRSFRLAQQGDLREAHRALDLAARFAGISGTLLTFPTLGWPFKQIVVSVPEEVSRQVLFFWTTTETVIHSEPGGEFSFWLLIAMALVGLLCYYLEKWLVHFAWRTFG